MPLAAPDDIVAALKDYGLNVIEWPGWRTRGRPYDFDPYAQAWHHDAFREAFSDYLAAKYMTEQGRPDLAPPLCNGAIGNYGGVYLCAYGNANHAGRNEADVHARLRAGLAPLSDARLDPDGDTVIGNPHLWGWECRNAGTGHDPWDQLDVMIRTGAAMADACGWSAMANVGHRELTARKIDPAGFDMVAFRAAIARAQAAHNARPASTPHLEDDMAYIVTCKGKPTRLKDGPTCPPISATTAAAAEKAGIPVIPHTPTDYAWLLRHVSEALGRDVVDAIEKS